MCWVLSNQQGYLIPDMRRAVLLDCDVFLPPVEKSPAKQSLDAKRHKSDTIVVMLILPRSLASSEGTLEVCVLTEQEGKVL